MLWQFWGATPEEINSPLAGDHVVPNATLVATRSITLSAPPETVFAWIQQMGFGKGGWYSYDFIDNLGRTSAMRIYPEWQNLQPGDEVPGGQLIERFLLGPGDGTMMRKQLLNLAKRTG